jgi:hypothetical protein
MDHKIKRILFILYTYVMEVKLARRNSWCVILSCLGYLVDEKGSAPCILSQPPMTILSDIHRCCARGFCGNHTIFQCPSSSFCDPYLSVAWTNFQDVVC